jgi:hypothetical protein
MKKLIDIPDDVKKKLQYLCIEENTNPKNWIEALVIKYVTLKSRQNGALERH